MAAKFVRNITKVLKSATGVLFGRVTSGTGRGEELTPSQVRSLLSVYTVTQTDTAISTAVNNLIGGSPGLLDTLDELAAALGDDANFASTVTTALAGKVNTSDLSESIDDRVAALLVAGTNITLTYNDGAGTLTVASTAGGLSGTGSTDNAVLRADGTGGATLQNSLVIIADTAATIIPVSSASAIPLICKGAASQSANLQEWQNSSGTVMISADMISGTNGRIRINGSAADAAITLSAFGADAYYDCNSGNVMFRTSASTRTNFTINNLTTKVATFGGAVTIGSSTDAAAANSTLYYSTTQSKLVWKDAGGVVNNLY